MINLIASTGQNNELGKSGKLIWPIKEDLKFFREKTIGHDIIMGRKTFESLPKLLEKRKHIVLTRGKITIPNVEIRNDIKNLITEYKNKDAFVIGGSTVYKQFIKYAQNIYLTEIEAIDLDADAFFPVFDKEKYIKTTLDEKYDETYKVNYKHILYKRR